MRRTFIAAALLLLAACSPRVDAPPDDHFDGRRFFNPDHEQGTGGSQRQTALGWIEKIARGREGWPAAVPVRSTVPPAHVMGDAMRVTWIGHATVLIQTQGRNILTDPIWSERSFPVPWAGPKRVRAPGVRFADLPRIDLVLVSHDHYDHFDAPTLQRLWRRDRPAIVAGLGVDHELARYGIPAIAADWGQTVRAAGLAVTLDRVHHWSQRTPWGRNATLWTGFTVHLPGGDLFFAGDTGGGDMRWAADAAREGPVRLAILPIGAIHADGLVSGNHIYPAQAVAAFGQLRAGAALGVHWGTFELTDEPIDYPRQKLAEALRDARIAPDRFRATEPGVEWAVPPLTPPSPASPPQR